MLGPLAKLLTGGGFRQVLIVASLPFLSRLYDPAAFGQLGAVMAVVSMSAVIVHGRYHLAIPVARDDAEAKTLLMLALLASAVFSLPASGVVLLAFGAGELNMPLALALAALLTFAGAFIDILTFWRSRVGRFGATGRFDAARAIGTIGAQFALSALGGVGLLLGSLAGASVSSVFAYRDAHGAFSRPGPTALVAAAKRYRDYALLGVPQGWLAAASKNVFPLLLLKFGGIALAGQYWLAYRLLLAPVALVGTAYRQVALPRFAKGDARSNRHDCAQHSIALLALGLVPTTLLLLHGEKIFTLLLGAQWAPAGVIAGWLGVAVLADACKIPATVLAQCEQRHGELLRWELGVAALRYVVAVPALVTGRPDLAIALFAVAGAAGWSAFVLVRLRDARNVAPLKA